MKEQRKARKLLVASVGVATASYLAGACSNGSVANLMVPAPPCTAEPTPYCVPTDAGDAGNPAETSNGDARAG